MITENSICKNSVAKYKYNFWYLFRKLGSLKLGTKKRRCFEVEGNIWCIVRLGNILLFIRHESIFYLVFGRKFCVFYVSRFYNRYIFSFLFDKIFEKHARYLHDSNKAVFDLVGRYIYWLDSRFVQQSESCTHLRTRLSSRVREWLVTRDPWPVTVDNRYLKPSVFELNLIPRNIRWNFRFLDIRIRNRKKLIFHAITDDKYNRRHSFSS